MLYRVQAEAGDYRIVKGEMVFEAQQTLANGLSQANATRIAAELNGTGTLDIGNASHGPLGESHGLLIARVRQLKSAIMDHLESGDRDFDKLADMVRSYADTQKAADVVSGQA